MTEPEKIEPTGFCAWHPEYGFDLDHSSTEKIVVERYVQSMHAIKETLFKGFCLSPELWQIKPVSIVEHGEYVRLKAIADWAVNANKELERTLVLGERDDKEIEIILEQYDAITSERGE